MGGAELFPRVEATVLTAEPFTVDEVGAGEMDDDPAAGEALDRFPIARLGVVPLSLSSARARAGIPSAQSVPQARVRSTRSGSAPAVSLGRSLRQAASISSDSAQA